MLKLVSTTAISLALSAGPAFAAGTQSLAAGVDDAPPTVNGDCGTRLGTYNG